MFLPENCFHGVEVAVFCDILRGIMFQGAKAVIGMDHCGITEMVVFTNMIALPHPLPQNPPTRLQPRPPVVLCFVGGGSPLTFSCQTRARFFLLAKAGLGK